MLVIATAQPHAVRQMIDTARTLNPDIEVVVRSHNAHEAELLALEPGSVVFLGEQELARAMVRHVLARVVPSAPGAAH